MPFLSMEVRDRKIVEIRESGSFETRKSESSGDGQRFR